MSRFFRKVKKFCHYARIQGLSFAMHEAVTYFKYILSKSNKPRRQTNFDVALHYDSVDILFIQCPPWDVEMPPLGIAYLSSYLRKHRHRTSVFDLNIALYGVAHKEIKYLWNQKSYDYWADIDLFKKTWLQLRDVTTKLLFDNLKAVSTKYIGISVNFASLHFAVELIRLIKSIKKHSKIIVGGWGCFNDHMRSFFPKELVDVFVVGEGEQALGEVIEALGDGNKNHSVAGAIFVKNGQPIYNPRLPVMDLDSIPWPTFGEFSLNAYRYPIVPLLTSRGCISNCSFCNDWASSRPYRFRSAQNVVREIKYHMKKNRINVFSFKDLLCNGNIAQLSLLSDLIINSGLKIVWDSQAIPRREMTYELLCKLKRSGCGTLTYGVETFSNNVLRRMRKLFTQDVIERALRDTYRAGIKTVVNIIVGFPGETDDDFQETVDGMKRNRPYIKEVGALSVCLINGGSDLDADSSSYGIVLPTDPKIRAKRWQDVGGINTYEIRRKRAERILALLQELDLPYATKTI